MNSSSSERKELAPYHRLGEPGGPGCVVGTLPISINGPDGSPIEATLLDGGPESTEVELLRTVLLRFGVRWGHDDFGWWAVAPGRGFPSHAVWRQDESGNRFLVEANLTKRQAEAMVKEYEENGHKQTYWCTDEQPG